MIPSKIFGKITPPKIEKIRNIKIYLKKLRGIINLCISRNISLKYLIIKNNSVNKKIENPLESVFISAVD